MPMSGSSGQIQVTPPSSTIPVSAMMARPAQMVVEAAIGIHMGGAGRSSGAGVSNRPKITTSTPVIASRTRAHSGRVSHQVPVSGVGSRASASRATSTLARAVSAVRCQRNQVMMRWLTSTVRSQSPGLRMSFASGRWSMSTIPAWAMPRKAMVTRVGAEFEIVSVPAVIIETG